ncbi:MAG: adenylate/guanylate cyclase domain-containing protein, partial [Geminicoccaceae bacterium]
MAVSTTVAEPLEPRRSEIERLVSDRVERAFRAEELAGLKLATRMLLIALAVIGVWLFVWVAPPRILFLETILALFALLALLNYRLASRDRPRSWWDYAAVALNFALLTFATVGYDLIVGGDWPPQMMLRNGTFVYFFVFLVIISLGYSPRLVLFAGIGSALAWSVGVWLIVQLPGTQVSLGDGLNMSPPQLLGQHLDPRFVDLDVVIQDLVVLLIVAGILAAGVWRGRRLVLRQAVAARERANLARYFAPTMVDRLAQTDEPLGTVRAQPVAVLFADIAGFTRLAEYEAPERVIALLRGLHARLEAAVFEHHGTLDKYLGDGVMATFGTPEAGPDDAANALASARAMLASIDAWNRDRAARGTSPLRLSIGIHYGEAVLGDVGSARRLEFAVIGDVVNVASRLEELTRELHARLVVSDALIEAVRAAGGQRAMALAGLERAAPQ